MTCFACNTKGHYRGAKVCKKRGKTRRLESDSESQSSSDYPEEPTADESSGDDGISGSDTSCERISTNRVKKRYVQKARRISGTRRSTGKSKGKTSSKYTVPVVINGEKTRAFADTGADICITSYKTAQKLKLPIQKTEMKIKPYGSPAKRCKGCYIGTIMHGDAVTNAQIYILNQEVETLLSGKVCEALGIIQFKEAAINRAAPEELEKQELISRFPAIFKGVGTLKNRKVKFHIDETVRPVCQHARPVPFHIRSRLRQELEKMEKEDIIEEHIGPSPWVSNLVLSPKDDGGIRVTVDMREPNRAIKPNKTPIPRPEEVRSELSSYTVFSKLDFRSAYHQLTLDEESSLLTVFHAGDRLMRYKRLTMGSCPATGELANALRPMFVDTKGAHVIQDDLIVGGEDREAHDHNLMEVCRIIKGSGMTLNLEKCLIGKTEIPWWGMKITSEGIKPDPEKVRALRHATPPANKEEVLSYLCMIQSNKEFIPHLSTKTANIRELTKKNKHFKWTPECQQEFEALQHELTDKTLVRHFDPSKKTFVFVDAHQTGISAILTQGKTMEQSRPVAYASRATTPTETRYPQLDLEALAIDYALRRYRFYLAGSPEDTTIITDHKPLEAIFRNRRSGSIRTDRIKMRHQDIRYHVVWRDGKSNPADYLSRHAVPRRHTPRAELEEANELEKTIWFLNYSPYTEAISIGKIIKESNKDSTLIQLKAALKRKSARNPSLALEPYKKILHEITVSDEGMVMRGERIILPQTLIGRALQKAHQGSHPGMSCLKRRIRSHFWFPKMDKHVEEYVAKCKECTIFTNKRTKDCIHPLTTDQEPWENVNIDLFGPMPDSKHVLVVTDNMTRFPAAKIVPGTSATPVLKALDTIYADFGQPKSHRTDNGPPFDSHAFQQFSNELGVTHIRTYPYHPQANPAETFMKPLGKAMKIAHHHRTDKEVALNKLLRDYRATPHSATGMAPGDLILRNGFNSELPRSTTTNKNDVETAKAKDKATKEARTEKLNQSKHRREQLFQTGDYVYTRNNQRTKFQPIFDPTPRLITDVGRGGVICTAEDGTVQRRHVDDVKHAEDQGQISDTEEPISEGEAAETTTTIREPDTPPRRSIRKRTIPAKLRDGAMVISGRR